MSPAQLPNARQETSHGTPAGQVTLDGSSNVQRPDMQVPVHTSEQTTGPASVPLPGPPSEPGPPSDGAGAPSLVAPSAAPAPASGSMGAPSGRRASIAPPSSTPTSKPILPHAAMYAMHANSI
jgi:hypothetical protein